MFLRLLHGQTHKNLTLTPELRYVSDAMHIEVVPVSTAGVNEGTESNFFQQFDAPKVGWMGVINFLG